MQTKNQHPNPQRGITIWMWVIFWIVVLFLLMVFFEDVLEDQRNPNQNIKTSVDNSGTREVVLQRNRFGHYNFSGQINGHNVEFLVDTGASDINIPATIANKIGLKRLAEVEFSTANGISKGYITKVNEVRVGDIILHNLRASINPNVDYHYILLGMSFLKRIEFTQRGDTLILRQFRKTE